MTEDRIKALEDRVAELEAWQQAFVQRAAAMKAQAEADMARMQPPFAGDRYRR